MAARDNVEEVADHSSSGRSDDAHRARKCGQRALAAGIEKSLGLEPFFELFKGQLQRARAHRLHGFRHQLHLPALLIHAHPSAHQHM